MPHPNLPHRRSYILKVRNKPTVQNRARKHLCLGLLVGVRGSSLRTQPQAGPPGTLLSEGRWCHYLDMICRKTRKFSWGKQNSSCKLKTVLQLTRKMSNFALFLNYFLKTHTAGTVQAPSLAIYHQGPHDGKKRTHSCKLASGPHVHSVVSSQVQTGKHL